jgi:hypothetical protein
MGTFLNSSEGDIIIKFQQPSAGLSELMKENRIGRIWTLALCS